MSVIQSEQFVKALRLMMQETFEQVQGIYLDRGTSLYETLAEIRAEEASIPVGGKCATLAAQVKHTAFYMEVTVRSVRESNFAPVDWNKIWDTVGAVSDEEWSAIQEELRTQHQAVLKLIEDTEEWPSEYEIAGAMALVAHTAYHLGEIRQALCTLRP